MSEKGRKLLQLVERVQIDWAPPKAVEGASLLEQGMMAVLTRHLSETQAEGTLRALRNAYSDWNVVRVSQIQEFRHFVKSKSEETRNRVARDLKTYLQEIFQKNHGFDIEWLRDEKEDAAKFVAELDFLGGAAAHHLLWLARSEELPVTPGIVRVLDRVGVMVRTSSMKKAQERLGPAVPVERRGDFARSLGFVAERWCDPRRPICWECVLFESCTHGRKVVREWKQQQKRLETQRKKEAARAAALQKKEEARRKREEARARKRAEAEARKAEREKKRREAEEARRRKKAEADAGKADAARRRAESGRKSGAASSNQKPAARRPTTKKKPTTRRKKA